MVWVSGDPHQTLALCGPNLHLVCGSDSLPFLAVHGMVFKVDRGIGYVKNMVDEARSSSEFRLPGCPTIVHAGLFT